MEEETDVAAGESTCLLQLSGNEKRFNPNESLKYISVTEIRNQQQEEILRKLGLNFDNLKYWRALSKIWIITNVVL